LRILTPQTEGPKNRNVAAQTPSPRIEPMHPIRITSVCETASGGVGRYQENLLALGDVGFSCNVLLPDGDRHILPASASVATFARRKRSLLGLIALMRGVLAQRRHGKPDLFFFNSTFAILPLPLIRILGDRSPAVYCAHCWAIRTVDAGSLKGRLVRLVEGRLCGLADLVINVSHSDAAVARQHGYRGRQVVVENAVATARPDARNDLFHHSARDGVHLLFVGRFDHQKGLDLLLAAFAEARKSNPVLRLHLVGGTVRNGMDPGLQDGVTNHGWISPDIILDQPRYHRQLLPLRRRGSRAVPVGGPAPCGARSCAMEHPSSPRRAADWMIGSSARAAAQASF
jgi:glycosyltransferase involved in cell wall biosynthesis